MWVLPEIQTPFLRVPVTKTIIYMGPILWPCISRTPISFCKVHCQTLVLSIIVHEGLKRISLGYNLGCAPGPNSRKSFPPRKIIKPLNLKLRERLGCCSSSWKRLAFNGVRAPGSSNRFCHSALSALKVCELGI